MTPFTPPDPLETVGDEGKLELEDLRARGNWGFKYMSAIMGPILVRPWSMSMGMRIYI